MTLFALVYRGVALELTRYEFRLLKVLAAPPGQVFSREQLMAAAWEDPGASLDRTVDAHIKTLRAKLRTVAADTDPIQTHRGLGYALRLRKSAPARAREAGAANCRCSRFGDGTLQRPEGCKTEGVGRRQDLGLGAGSNDIVEGKGVKTSHCGSIQNQPPCGVGFQGAGRPGVRPKPATYGGEPA